MRCELRPSSRRGSLAATLVLAIGLGVAGWPAFWRVQGPHPLAPLFAGELLVAVEVGALLLWRWPRSCFLVAEAALVTYGILRFPSTPANYAGLLATAVAACMCSSTPWRAAVLVAALAGVLVIGETSPRGVPWAALVANGLLVAGAWFAGWGVRNYRFARTAELQRLADAETLRVAEEHLEVAALLHDRVANTMAVVSRQLEAAQYLAPARREAMLELAGNRLRGSLRDVEHLVRSWSGKPTSHPTRSTMPRSETARDDLKSVVASFVEALGGAGIEVELSTEGIEGVPCHDSLLILADQLLCEVCSNVVKHSAASCVRLEVATNDGALRVRVEDPGPARSTAGTGTGLDRLQLRIEAIGGRLSAGPAIQGGFDVQALLPLLPPAAVATPTR